MHPYVTTFILTFTKCRVSVCVQYAIVLYNNTNMHHVQYNIIIYYYCISFIFIGQRSTCIIYTYI